LLLVLGLTIATGAYFARSVAATKADLQASSANAQALQQAITVGDKVTATSSLSNLQATAAAAHRHSDSPIWKVASLVPFIGDDVEAVSVVSEVLNDVASRVMPPLVDISTKLDLNTFAPHKGKVDLAALATLRNPIAQANTLLYTDNARLKKIDPTHIIGPLRGPVTEFTRRINDAATGTRVADDVLGLVPTMLGDSNRTYLFVFQNNAEARATGGITGAFLLAKVNRGHIKLGDQGTAANFGAPTEKFKLTAEEKTLYSKRMGAFVQDATLTPEFPRAAEILKFLTKARLGVDVDGVVAVDPIAMSYVLAGTGPVTVDGTQVTAKNAVSELLNKSYLRLTAGQQDTFFADTAAKLFTTVTDGVGNTGQTVREIVRASNERRILVWSAHPTERAKLDTMSVAATLKDDATLQPTLGVYFADTVGAKLDYYLHAKTDVTGEQCKGFGTQTLTAKVTLRSTVPPNPSSLPYSILGYSQKDRPGVIRINLSFYLPTGGALVSSSLNKVDLGNDIRTHKGHSVATVAVAVKPGETSTAKITFRTAPGQGRTVMVTNTPGAQPGRHVTIEPSRCS